MSKQLIYLVSFVFVFGLILTSGGNAAEANLVGWWKLDETSGTIAHDASGNGNDGTIKGDPMWVVGKIDGAINLDGDGDYVDVGRVGISGIAQRTIAGWARASTTAIPSWTTVFGFAPDGSTEGTYFDIAVDDMGNYAINVQGWAGVFGPVDTEWHHFAVTYTGSGGSWYLDSQYIDVSEGAVGTIDQFRIGARLEDNKFFPGIVDDVRIYNKPLTLEEIQKIMAGSKAYNPVPADGALYKDTWINLGWLSGNTATSHDVYFGDNFDDVNDGSDDTFQGNQTVMYFLAGAPGSPYPDGLVPGTTYYWRIDEVEADGITVHKGETWRFTVPSKRAYFPDPPDGAKFIETNAELSWTSGFGAKLHTVYFGDNFNDVNNAADGFPKPLIGHNPGPLESGKTYYWRIDEVNSNNASRKGDIWSFTIRPEIAYRPYPSDGCKLRQQNVTLNWMPGSAGVLHDVYFGTDPDQVNGANTSDTSGIYRGRANRTNYTPSQLDRGRNYYWRIDEVEANGTKIHEGNVWSFTVTNIEVVEYQVSSSEDDGYAANENLQNIDFDYLKVGFSTFYQLPYYTSGIVFRNLNIPKGAEIISAHLKIRSYNNQLSDVVYGRIQAEAADNASGLGGAFNIGLLDKTGTSIDWDIDEAWSADTWYTSPDIAGVIQEVINRSGWLEGNSLAIIYSTRLREGGCRNISSFVRGADYAPTLEITYIP